MVVGALRIVVGAASHTGLVRERNEDSALSTSGVFAVADGMGGHAAGDVASRIAVAALMRLAGRDDLRSRDILDAVDAANDDILNSIDADGQRAGMGTTLTGVAIVTGDTNPRWAVFNVGDSRVYRFAGDTLTQLTEDHSEVGELVAAGQLTAEQAAVYPRRNVITRSLGTVPGPHPDIWLLEPEAPERFVICSDGLTSELSDDEIAAVLRAESEPQRAADRLVVEAVQAGGRDNVTVLVIDSN
jgi:serine/threonine protein phosphatase PrpC